MVPEWLVETLRGWTDLEIEKREGTSPEHNIVVVYYSDITPELNPQRQDTAIIYTYQIHIFGSCTNEDDK